jgi:hypothetical protein
MLLPYLYTNKMIFSGQNINVGSADMKNGFLRFISGAAFCLLVTQASAAIFVYDATLGNFESPPTGSPGTGFAEVTIDTAANTLRAMATFNGLTSATTASHIHCCTTLPDTGTAIVATTTPSFPNFPLGVTSGSYDQTFDVRLASTYNSAFILANGGTADTAFQALLAGLNADDAYLNIHTANFPGGEIRGFLHAVPEPSTWLMMILGFFGVGFIAHRRRQNGRVVAAA